MLAQITGEDLRSVMRHVPSPVTVVTLEGADGPRGITIGSFTSVSLNPPLISFNVMREAVAHDPLLEAQTFAVHILHENQAMLSERFSIPALSSEDQFRSLKYEIQKDGLPILADVLAVMRCIPYQTIAVADHSLMIGQVVDAEVVSPGKPLVYYKQSYREVGDITSLKI